MGTHILGPGTHGMSGFSLVQYEHKIQGATMNKFISTISDESGASMIEYALLVILIAIVAIVAVQATGDSVSSLYSEIPGGFVTSN